MPIRITRGSLLRREQEVKASSIKQEIILGKLFFIFWLLVAGFARILYHIQDRVSDKRI